MMKPPHVRPAPSPGYKEISRRHLDTLLQIRDMGDDLARAFAARPGREAALNALRMLRMGSDIGPGPDPDAEFEAELAADLDSRFDDELWDEEDTDDVEDLPDRSTDDLIAELVEELGLDPETIYGERNRRHAAEMAAILARLAAPDEAQPKVPPAIAAPATPRTRPKHAPRSATVLPFKHPGRK